MPNPTTKPAKKIPQTLIAISRVSPESWEYHKTYSPCCRTDYSDNQKISLSLSEPWQILISRSCALSHVLGVPINRDYAAEGLFPTYDHPRLWQQRLAFYPNSQKLRRACLCQLSVTGSRMEKKDHEEQWVQGYSRAASSPGFSTIGCRQSM